VGSSETNLIEIDLFLFFRSISVGSVHGHASVTKNVGLLWVSIKPTSVRLNGGIQFHFDEALRLTVNRKFSRVSMFNKLKKKFRFVKVEIIKYH